VAKEWAMHEMRFERLAVTINVGIPAMEACSKLKVFKRCCSSSNDKFHALVDVRLTHGYILCMQLH
jgi:hypothetical protein